MNVIKGYVGSTESKASCRYSNKKGKQTGREKGRREQSPYNNSTFRLNKSRKVCCVSAGLTLMAKILQYV